MDLSASGQFLEGRGRDALGVWLRTGWLAAAVNSEFLQASIYSLLMTGVVRVTGFNEVALRLPSVMAAAGAAVLLYALCRRMFGSLSAAYSLLLWLSIGEVGRAGPNIRPYASVLFFTALAMYALVRAGRRWHPGWMALNGIAYGAAICASLFDIVLPAMQIAFLGLAATRGWISWQRTIWIAPGLTGLLTLPVVPLFLMLRGQTANHSYVPLPTRTDLGVMWLPPRWVIAAVAAADITMIFARPPPGINAPITVDAAAAARAVLQPLRGARRDSGGRSLPPVVLDRPL